MRGMEPTALVLSATALGAAVGAGATLGVIGARRAGKLRSAHMRPELPEVVTTLLDEIDAFAVILDSSLATVYANPTAREERNLSDEELGAPSFLARVRRVMSSGVPDTHEPDPEDPADNVRTHLFRLQRRFVVVLAEDLGEEQRVNAMRRDFIANVSHELKTPIAAIGLLAEAVQQAADDPELVREFSKTLVKESRRLGSLSRDIIQLSEAQSALRPEERERVDIRLLVRGEVDAHRALATQSGITLVVTDADERERDASLMGRPAALAAAVANLLSNAIRHSSEGERVGIGMAFEKKRFLVTVTDQGEGIAGEHLSRIFERFYRVDSARSRDGGGTGLGLSITRHTMRAHGGDVDVWSQPGVGSSFTLTFPLHEDPDDRRKRAKKKVKRAFDPGHKKAGKNGNKAKRNKGSKPGENGKTEELTAHVASDRKDSK